ncbi:MAG: SDR family oxidoreductase [Pseudomonadota bacterium]
MKTIIVTGGAKGIGAAIVRDLARDHQVCVTWKTTPTHDLPAGVLALQADLTQEGAPEQVVQDTIEHFGTLDGIVNNAGLVRPTPPEATQADAVAAQMAVNVAAPARLLSAALPHLGRGAAVVNISSVNAVLPPKGAAMFGASKAALEVWTRGMAKELGPRGIRVNAVSPGAIEDPENPRSDQMVAAFTELTALGHLGAPDDIAAAVRFLMAPEARFITGQVLRVCGGYRL